MTMSLSAAYVSPLRNLQISLGTESFPKNCGPTSGSLGLGGMLILLAVSTIGCSLLAREGLSDKQVLQLDRGGAESESNLPAIRALLARERQQFHERLSPANWPATYSADDDISSSTVRPDNPTSVRLDRTVVIAPHLSTSVYQHAAQIRVPVPTTRSSTDYSAQDRPTAAPYTFYAPPGSAYPGTIRCVPDYLGGQRCHNSP